MFLWWAWCLRLRVSPVPPTIKSGGGTYRGACVQVVQVGVQVVLRSGEGVAYRSMLRVQGVREKRAVQVGVQVAIIMLRCPIDVADWWRNLPRR